MIGSSKAKELRVWASSIGQKKKGKLLCALLLQRRIGLASSVIAVPEKTAPGTGWELGWGQTRIKSRWCGRVPGFSQRCTGIGRSNEYLQGTAPAGQSNRLIVADKFLLIARRFQ